MKQSFRCSAQCALSSAIGSALVREQCSAALLRRRSCWHWDPRGELPVNYLSQVNTTVQPTVRGGVVRAVQYSIQEESALEQHTVDWYSTNYLPRTLQWRVNWLACHFNDEDGLWQILGRKSNDEEGIHRCWVHFFSWSGEKAAWVLKQISGSLTTFIHGFNSCRLTLPKTLKRSQSPQKYPQSGRIYQHLQTSRRVATQVFGKMSGGLTLPDSWFEKLPTAPLPLPNSGVRIWAPATWSPGIDGEMHFILLHVKVGV